MNKIKAALKALRKKVTGLWDQEPAMVLAAGSSALIGVLAAFGVTISHDTAGEIVEIVAPLLLGGAIRTQVSPA